MKKRVLKKKKMKPIVIGLSFIVIGFMLGILFYMNAQKSDGLPWYLEYMDFDKNLSLDTNQDVIVAFLDTGIHDQVIHEYQDRLIKPFNVITGDEIIHDENGHGTSIVSLAASNGFDDIIGINPRMKIMPIVVAGSDGITSPQYLAEGIHYAVDQRANIICITLGSRIDYEEVRIAIERAIFNEIVVIAASGDKDRDQVDYPARYDGVIAVSSQSRLKHKYMYANIDEKSLLIPGENIKCSYFFGENLIVDYRSGSSYSAAIYSGLVSLRMMNNGNTQYEILLNDSKELIQEYSFINFKKFIRSEKPL